MSSALGYAGELSPVAQLLNEFADAELPNNNRSNVLEASRLVLGGPGYVVSLTVNNTNAAAQFIQLHDSPTIPATGAVPSVVFTVSGSADKIVTYVLPGRFFKQGIVIANSSTAATLTAGSADCFFDVQYLPAS